MHTNHRRKNKRQGRSFWNRFGTRKKEVLHNRVVKRRQKTRQLIHHEEYDDIEQYERPVDWYEID